MLSQEVIKRLKQDSDFKAFCEYVENCVEELNRVDNLVELPEKEVGKIALARGHALLVLHAILSPIVEFSEKKQITEDDRKKALKSVGL